MAEYRNNHAPRLASAAISATCHTAFNRNVSSSSLLVFIGLLLMFRDQFLQACEFFRRQVFGFDETHHETFGRTTKETIDDVGNVLADHLLTAHSRFVEVGAVLQSAFCFSLSFEDI